MLLRLHMSENPQVRRKTPSKQKTCHIIYFSNAKSKEITLKKNTTSLSGALKFLIFLFITKNE